MQIAGYEKQLLALIVMLVLLIICEPLPCLVDSFESQLRQPRRSRLQWPSWSLVIVGGLKLPVLAVDASS